MENEYENMPSHELRFAWRQRQPEIDEFIQQLPSSSMSTAFVVAQHGGGKSTTLPAHISDLMQQKEVYKNTVILYLVSCAHEQRVLLTFVGSDGFDAETVSGPCFSIDPQPTFVAMSNFPSSLPGFRDFVGNICNAGNSLLLLLDLEISPSSEGEVMLGLAMEWAAKASSSSANKGNGLMILSNYRSPRTIDALTRVLGQPPTFIDVPRLHVNVGREVLHRDEVDHVQRLLLNHGGLRCVLHFNPSWDESLEEIDMVELESHYIKDLVLESAFSLNQSVLVYAAFPFSFHVRNLTYVITSGTVEVPCFRRDVVQPVTQLRSVTQLELDRELSWAHKADVPDDVMIYCPESLLGRPLSDGIDALGPAFLANRYRTVLEFIGFWPNTSFTKMPIRFPSEWHILRDYCRKLKLFQCIENLIQDGQQHDAVHHLTVKGTRVLRLCRMLPDMDFHAVHILETALSGGESGWSTNLVRVALRLVAVVEVSPRLCGRHNHKEELSLQELQDQCIGTGQSQAAFGGLWASLGVWQKQRSSSQVGGDFQALQQLGPVIFSQHPAYQVLTSLPKFESLARIGGVLNEQVDTTLTESEVAVLEDALLDSFIDQVAFYDCKRDKWFEVATQCELEADPAHMINTTELCRRSEFKYGFFVTYGQAHAEATTKVSVWSLTVVPRRAIRNVVAREGLPFTRALATQFPTSR